MTRRLLPIAILLVALVSLATACGGDNGSAADDTKAGDATSQSSPDASAGDVDDPAVEPVSDEEFAEQMGGLHSMIENAGDDLCALSEALGSVPPDPTNAEQTKQYSDTYVLMLHNIAKILGPETEHGAPVEDAANKFAARTAELEYSPTFISDQVLQEIMNAQPVSLGLVEFGQRAAAECAGQGG